MKIKEIFKINLLIASVMVGSLNATAQKDTTKLKQEVEVSKNYQPSILDVEKINDIPKIKTEQTEPPTFDYSIYSKPVYSIFDLTPVAAAKMVGDPKPELENGLLKLGLGNDLTAYGELFYNVQPDKNSNFGMHFMHLSSSGKVILLNDDHVKAPESENVAEIFGKKFFKKSTLSGTLGYNRKAFKYYGYTGTALTDADKDLVIPYFEDKQHFSQVIGDVRLKSGKTYSSDINYDLGFNYHYLISNPLQNLIRKIEQKEHQSIFSADLSKKFDKTIGLLNTSFTYYRVDGITNRFLNALGLKQQTVIRVNPSVMWKSDDALLQLGVNSTMVFDKDVDSQLFFYPKAKAEWSPVPNILTLFAGVDGYLQHNTYSTIANENPYVDPFHDIANAKFAYILNGGFKGKLSSKTNFVAQATYSLIKNQHFYYLESSNFTNPLSTTSRLNNTFSVLYDDVKVLKLSGEVLHTVTENFSIRLLGNFYSYELSTLEKPWQMPVSEVTFSGIYKATDQLKFNADIFFVGSRDGLVMDPIFPATTTRKVVMDPIIDLNVGAEYKFTDKLSFFVKLNNFGFQKYEQWLGYTNKGFNGLAGLSYLF